MIEASKQSQGIPNTLPRMNTRNEESSIMQGEEKGINAHNKPGSEVAAGKPVLKIAHGIQ